MMFAAVSLLNSEVGFKGIFRDMFREPEIHLNRVDVPEGDPFYHVGVKEYRGQIPVFEVCERLKRLKGGVIFSLDFPVSEECQRLVFHESVFKARLLFNTALDFFKSLALNPFKNSICIFDNDGIYLSDIEKLVLLFSRIEIFTLKLEAYRQCAGLLFEKYGISIAVSSFSGSRAPNHTFIISPYSLPFSSYFNGTVFTNGDYCPPCGCAMSGYGVSLPSDYELLRPKGIDKMAFAAALYEKSGAKALGELPFENIIRY